MIKWHFKEDIFEQIDTPDKAYWIGFLYADGYILSKGNGFGVSLKKDDVNHIYKFLDFIKLEENKEDVIKYAEEQKAYRLILTREKTHQNLVNLGFTSNKSYDTTLTVWNNIPNEYKKEFILGLWDGDGSFSITPSGEQLSSLISNNQKLIVEIAKYIDNNLEPNFSNIHFPTEGDPYPRIRFTKNKAKLFGDWLYDNKSNYKLDRKYEAYSKMMIHSQAHCGIDNGKAKGILCIESNKCYATAKECCMAEFGLSNPGAMNNIRAVCRGEAKATRGKHFRYLTSEEKEIFANAIKSNE